MIVTATAAVAFLLAFLATSWVLTRPDEPAIRQSGPTVVIAMPELTWDDVSPTRTPRLWALMNDGAIANVATRNLLNHSCSDQSWMTLSAGSQTVTGKIVPATARNQPVDPCVPLPRPTVQGDTATFPSWTRWRALTMGRSQREDLGLLASVMHHRGECVGAVGPTAAFGAADRSGVVKPYAATLAQADFTACPVTLVHLDRPTDQALGQVLDRLPPRSTVAVTGLAYDSTPEQLRALVVSGPGVPRGLLSSPATRQPGLVKAPDLTALLLQRGRSLARPGPSIEGRLPAVKQEDTETAFEHVRSVSRQLRYEHGFVAPFFYGYGIAVAALLAVGAVLRRRSGRLGRRWLVAVGATAAAVPVSTFLVGLIPWQDTATPGIALTAGILGLAAIQAAIALLGPWRHWAPGPAVALAAFTACVIALDVTHASPLQLTSMLGLQPVYGNRFYGMGNVAFALFASSSLLVAALVAGRWRSLGAPKLAGLTVLLIGGWTIVVDGHPSWGAEAGGPLALLPAFAYLALNAAGLMVTWRRILVIGGLTALVAGGLATLDYLRPAEDRTHIGDFLDGLLKDGRTQELTMTVQQNFALLTDQPINLFVPVLMLLVVAALLFPRSRLGRPLAALDARTPMLGHGLAAIAVVWMISFATNDSGTAIPAAGLLIMVPMVILLASSRGRSMPREAASTADERSAEPVPAG